MSFLPIDPFVVSTTTTTIIIIIIRHSPPATILGKRLRSVSIENILQPAVALAAPSPRVQEASGSTSSYSSTLRTRVMEAFYAKRTPPVPVVVAELKSFIPSKDVKEESQVVS